MQQTSLRGTTSSPARIGLQQLVHPVAHLREKRLDFELLATHAGMNLPLLDRLGTVQNLIEGVADPKQLVSAQVHECESIGWGRLAGFWPELRIGQRAWVSRG